MLYVAIALYAAAIVAANLIVLAFGPAVMPLNSFFLIGLDLALRDWLHLRLRAWQMLALIAATGLLTWALNPAAQAIAIASACAFAAAALVDWTVFAALPGSWMKRSLASNTAGALVDSIVFPTLAFGVFAPERVLAQFAAKVAGGAFWAYVIRPRSHA